MRSVLRGHSGGRRKKTSAFDLELPIMSMDASVAGRGYFVGARRSMSVVNCLGVCCRTARAAIPARCIADFVETPAGRDSAKNWPARCGSFTFPFPGTADEDRTAFSVTKREAEAA